LDNLKRLIAGGGDTHRKGSNMHFSHRIKIFQGGGGEGCIAYHAFLVPQSMVSRGSEELGRGMNSHNSLVVPWIRRGRKDSSANDGGVPSNVVRIFA